MRRTAIALRGNTSLPSPISSISACPGSLPPRSKNGRRNGPRSAIYLGFLADFPDSHIVRKYGSAVAKTVQDSAIRFHAQLQSSWDPSRLADELLAWDAALKANNINPGTSADLTVATLFAHRLATILPSARNSG